MNQAQTFRREEIRPSLSLQQPEGGEEPCWLDIVALLQKRFRFLAALVFFAVAAGSGISLFLPKIYESTATLLPQVENKDAGGLGALLAATGVASTAQTLGVNLPGMTATPTDIFLSILKSRTMADDVIQRFHLLERYDARFMQDARLKLEGATRLAVTKEKVIKITVEDRDPALAAEIANFYVSNLDRLNQTMGVTKASDNRKFVEERLKETQEELVKAEEALKEFQTQNKTVAIEAQSKAMIEAVATLQAQATAQEVQLQVMGSYLSKDNPELVRVRSSIDELRKQLSLMELGRRNKGTQSGERPQPGIISVPTLALEYGRLMRNLKIQETLYALLTSQYEQAKLSEARDTPTVQVLDTAVPAERKSRPRVMLNGFLAGGFALLVGILFVVLLEWREKHNVK